MATVVERVSEFKNEPLIDFKDPANQSKMEAALAAARAEDSATYDLIINGRRVRGAGTFQTKNPAKPSESIGIVQKASQTQAREAVAAAEQAFYSWSHVPASQRADLLFKTAALAREHRFALDALLVLEVGKSWAEADGDVAEGIDFLEYYAREMLRLDGPHPVTPVTGEKNMMMYIPLGVGVVIPPWNFAFAIMAGMTAAAIVTGNTVVLKPSSDSPVIAYKFVELLEQAGMPPGVVNLVTGSGSEIGDLLVQHPRVRFISFTGSKDVGLHINQLAATPQPGQIWIKRVVAEMGGKDSIVVAADADLDAAVEGVAQAAFGFQGQKCSACSRAIVDERVYDKFLDSLKARVEKITVGNPAENANMGAVINEGSMNDILRYIEIGKKEGRLLTGGGRATQAGPGYFLQPTVFADIAPKSTLEQEEIFGPVLVVIKSRNFDHALEIANDTEFGLTGAVYTKSRDKIERAYRDFHVGNLYINRKCTGAIVAAHPFGGFNMSGTDSKAGGPDYLYLFSQGKSVGEKIID